MSDLWKKIKIDGIKGPEKVVAEFNIYMTEKSPYKKMKIKVFESNERHSIGHHYYDTYYEAFCDLRLEDGLGDFVGAVGHGSTIEETLSSAIRCYYSDIVSRKEISEWGKEDISYSDDFDFY